MGSSGGHAEAPMIGAAGTGASGCPNCQEFSPSLSAFCALRLLNFNAQDLGLWRYCKNNITSKLRFDWLETRGN